jgi:hypothetical protein
LVYHYINQPIGRCRGDSGWELKFGNATRIRFQGGNASISPVFQAEKHHTVGSSYVCLGREAHTIGWSDVCSDIEASHHRIERYLLRQKSVTPSDYLKSLGQKRLRTLLRNSGKLEGLMGGAPVRCEDVLLLMNFDKVTNNLPVL